MGNACSCIEPAQHQRSPHSSPRPTAVEPPLPKACAVVPSQQADEHGVLSPAERAHRLVEATFAMEALIEDAFAEVIVDSGAENGEGSSDWRYEGDCNQALQTVNVLTAECARQDAAAEDLDRTLLGLKEEIQRLAKIRDQIIMAKMRATGTKGEREDAADAGPTGEAVCDAPSSLPVSRQFTADQRELGLSPWVLTGGGQDGAGLDPCVTAAFDYISKLDDLECPPRKPAPRLQHEEALEPSAVGQAGPNTAQGSKKNVKIMWIPRALQAHDEASPVFKDARGRPGSVHECKGKVEEQAENGFLFADAEQLVETLGIQNFVTRDPPSLFKLPHQSLSFFAPPFLHSANPEPIHHEARAIYCSSMQSCVGIDPPGGDSKARPAAWLGPEPHLKVRVNEQLIRVRIFLLSVDDAAEISGVRCELSFSLST